MKSKILVIALTGMLALATGVYAGDNNNGNGNNCDGEENCGAEHVMGIVLYNGNPVHRADVVATCDDDDGTTKSGQTNNNGEFHIPLDCEGEVYVEATKNGATGHATGTIQEHVAEVNGITGVTYVYIYLDNNGAELPEYPAGILSAIMSVMGIGLAGRKTMF